MTMTAPVDLGDLAETLREIAELPPLERARALRGLDTRSRAILGAEGDRAVFDASMELDATGARRRSHREIADALGVGRARVANAITRHRKRLTEANVRSVTPA